VSGAVITIAGAGQAGSAAIATAVLIIAAAAVWVLVTAVALRQLWTRRFRAALTPDRWEDRRFYDPDAVKAQMLDEAAAAYRENRKINRRKEKALRIAIAGAAGQTLLLAAALVAGVLA
jgi:hypothetical protein